MQKSKIIFLFFITLGWSTQFFAIQFTSVVENKNILGAISDVESNLEEIYIAVDIKADGPTPLDGNMVTLAAIATDLDLNILGYFEVNMEPHRDPHPEVLTYLMKQPAKYKRIQAKAIRPQVAMREYLEWMRKVSKGKKITTLALPIGYDKMWIQSYSTKFGGKGYLPYHRPEDILDSVGGIDIETLVIAYLAIAHNKFVSYVDLQAEQDVPKELQQPGLSDTYNPLEGVIRAMVLGINLLRYFHKLDPIILDHEIVKTLYDVSKTHFEVIDCNP